MQKPEQIVINRSTWIRGIGCTDSALLRRGKMCCLGFYAKACGVSDEQMDQIKTPRILLSIRGIQLPGLLCDFGGLLSENDVTQALITANDTTIPDEPQREATIVEHFAKIGVTV